MITRRKFVALTSLGLASSVSGEGLPWKSEPPSKTLFGDDSRKPLSNQKSGSNKKGGCIVAGDTGWNEKLTNLQCKWFYTWAGFVPADSPAAMEFVPMIRSRHANPEMISRIVQSFSGHDIKHLLGLNEPDQKEQDGISVEEALDLWPLLMEVGPRLGSPACVHPDNQWMQEFMAGVKERQLRVDFICIHSYGGPNPEALLDRLERIHEMYDERPLWITEFAVGDWQAKTPDENRHSEKSVLRFMEVLLPKLNRLDYLERYAWFCARPESAPLGSSALFNADGTLTKLGECYRDA